MEINMKPIAMAYVPWQVWRNIYEPPKALMTGTIFAELDKPFTGRPPESNNCTKGGCRNGKR